MRFLPWMLTRNNNMAAGSGRMRGKIKAVTFEPMNTDMRWVLDYWSEKAGNADQPSIQSFRLVDLPAQALVSSILVDVGPGPSELSYRYWGSQRTVWFGRDLTGKEVAHDWDADLRRQVLSQYQSVLAKGEPSVDSNIYPMAGGLWGEFLTLRLPLVGASGRVERIYALTQWCGDVAMLDPEGEVAYSVGMG